MIVTQTPFRVSFCGGGSDLPSFYKNHPGCVLSTTIDKYVYISIHPSFYTDHIVLKYNQTENVLKHEHINHKIFRTVLESYGIKGIEITVIADIPSGTGLGSSSSFTVGLLHAINKYLNKNITKEFLAAEACNIEINKLNEPIGKQDQYAATYGGLNFITFNSDDSIDVEPVKIDPLTFKELEDNLLMFYTGTVRSASEILKNQNDNMHNKNKFDNIIKMTQLTSKLKVALESGNLNEFGTIMNENWLLKKTLSSKISNPKIDYYYNLAIKNGALGGKLLGAGGCGFLLFYARKDNHEKLRRSLKDLREINFRFDSLGSTIIY